MQKTFLFLLFVVVLGSPAQNQGADCIKGVISGLSLQYNLMRRNCLLEGRRKGRRDVKKERKEGRKDEEEEVSS